MPSESILKEKKKIVDEMTERLKSQAGVFVDYKGITVNEDTEMRVKMRAASVNYSVIKNRLMKLAIKNVGFDELDSILVGTTSLAISDDDPIAPARIIKEYADKHQNYFEIKAGFMDGRVLSADEVNAIASIPALPVLQARFLGTLLAPITSLAIVLREIAEKGGAPADIEADVPVKQESAEEAPKKEAAPEKEESLESKESTESPTKETSDKATEEAPAKEATADVKKKEPAKAPAKAPAKKPSAKKTVKEEADKEESPAE